MRFEVFKNGKRFEDFNFCGAYLFGTDGIAIRRAQISFKDGCIECKKPHLETAGLALLWPVDGFGKVLLATTCLPERAQPYNLNVEITRGKLKEIIIKREDWLFPNNVEGLRDISEEAQELFIKAVQNISDPPLASKLADESLKKAIIYSEKLAGRQAQSLFNLRGKNHGFGRGCFGCCVNAGRIGDSEYVDRLLELFSFVMVPINWAQIEPEEGKFDFSRVDKCIEVLGDRRVAIGAGPLLYFSRDYIPKWLLREKRGFERILESTYRFVSGAATRYPGSIRAWCVTSGLNAFNHFGFGFEQVLELNRAANVAVKSASDRALRIIEITNPWGEYYAITPDTIPPLVYLDMIIQSGVNFDAIGLQMRFGKNESGLHIRDMMQISSILDCFGVVGKPLYITDVGVPSQNGSGLQEPEVAGVWHEEWNESRQGQWIEQFYKIALSKSFVDAIVHSNLVDSEDSTIANSGLLTGQLEAKKSFQTLKKLRNTIFNR